MELVLGLASASAPEPSLLLLLSLSLQAASVTAINNPTMILLHFTFISFSFLGLVGDSFFEQKKPIQRGDRSRKGRYPTTDHLRLIGWLAFPSVSRSKRDRSERTEGWLAATLFVYSKSVCRFS
ncbi:MAG: hypothetical protein MPW16_06860 [Candidatus Manganitrophus sp.]|nr:MAG: hypothetical protein MPW16_06860 [Candidatus Manganitrophus sp.]